MLRRIIHLVLLIAAPSLPTHAEQMSGSSKEARFWQWFEANESMLYAFEKNPDKAFDELSEQMNRVDEHLAFLFGPIREDSTREFILSANGITTGFPAVEALHAAAPNLPRWTIGKFRPRVGPPEGITLQSRTLQADDISFRMYEDGQKVGFLIFMEGLTENEQYLFQHIGFLFLDHTLGEYDVGTKVGFIEFLPASDERAEGASPLSDLTAQFDEHFIQRQKGLH